MDDKERRDQLNTRLNIQFDEYLREVGAHIDTVGSNDDRDVILGHITKLLEQINTDLETQEYKHNDVKLIHYVLNSIRIFTVLAYKKK